jgi:hypothetical protein
MSLNESTGLLTASYTEYNSEYKARIQLLDSTGLGCRSLPRGRCCCLQVLLQKDKERQRVCLARESLLDLGWESAA